jgi:hypothetical protein
MDSTPLNLDAWQTTLAAAQANTLASSTATAQHLNDELKNRYLSAFNDWTISVLAGRIDNSNPPQPPAGYDVVTGPEGFAWPALGTTPVAVMPPVPPDHSKPQVQTFPEPDNIRNVPPGDTMPVGYTLNAPDGSRWQKQASPTPFGVAYYYAKVA